MARLQGQGQGHMVKNVGTHREFLSHRILMGNFKTHCSKLSYEQGFKVFIGQTPKSRSQVKKCWSFH